MSLTSLGALFKNNILKTLMLFALGLSASSAFSQTDDDDDDLFDFDEEITCESLEEDFKQYSDIIKVYQVAFSQSLAKISTLLKKVQNQEISEEEMANVSKELSLSRRAMSESEFALHEKEWRIAEAISKCI